MSHPIEAKNFIDRAIEAVAPAFAARRYAARAQIEVARSIPVASYRGAVATRSSQSWGKSTSYRGGSQRDRRDLGTMRDRGRKVYRENVIGRSLLDTETDNVVADGFTLQMKTSSPAFNKEAEARFYKWLDTADVSGKMTGADLFRTSWREPRKDGDGGFVLIERGGYPKLQYIPGDWIRNPYAGYDPRTMFDGVECDRSGRATRFWVRDVEEATGKDTVSPVDARDFVYLAHLDGPMAIRGGTVYGPIFTLLDQADAFVDAVTKAAIMGAIFGLVEKRRNPAAVTSPLGTTTNAAGEQQKAVTYENGMMKVIGHEDSLLQVQATQPIPQAPDFLRALFRVICLAFDMPLEIGQKDLSQVNFSGGRIGLIGYYRSCRVKQDWLKGRCWNRIIYWWLSKERQRRALGYDDAFAEAFPDDYGAFDLHGEEWAYTDPLTEAQADLLEISMGTNSLQRVCARRGRDYDRIQHEIAETRDLRQELKLPMVLSNVTRDEQQRVLQVDADGNPISGGGPLNGVQIASAMAVLAQVGERTLGADAAIVLLTKLGIPEDAAKAIATSAANSTELTPGDRDFERQFLLKLMEVQGAKQVLYNITNIPSLAENTGLPLDRTVQTTPDQGVPLLPVVADSGPLVSGDSINDPAGDLVGGDVENVAPADPPASPDAAKGAGNGQDEQKDGQQAAAGGDDGAKPAGTDGGGA